MKRSPATVAPLSSRTLSTKPLSPFCLTSTTLPSIRLEPRASADGAESMYIGVSDTSPVVELDTELERAAGPPDEVRFVDLEQAVEVAQMRDRRLADPDDADLLGFDQRHLEPLAEGLGERRSRHPSGAAPTDDDDRAKRLAGGLRGVLSVHGVAVQKKTREGQALPRV